jgi:hypothetical protein
LCRNPQQGNILLLWGLLHKSLGIREKCGLGEKLLQ